MFIDLQIETVGDFFKWLFFDAYRDLWMDADNDIPTKIVLSVYYAVITIVWVIVLVAFAAPVLVIKEVVKSLIDKIKVKKSNPFKA